MRRGCIFPRRVLTPSTPRLMSRMLSLSCHLPTAVHAAARMSTGSSTAIIEIICCREYSIFFWGRFALACQRASFGCNRFVSDDLVSNQVRSPHPDNPRDHDAPQAERFLSIANNQKRKLAYSHRFRKLNLPTTPKADFPLTVSLQSGVLSADNMARSPPIVRTVRTVNGEV